LELLSLAVFSIFVEVKPMLQQSQYSAILLLVATQAVITERRKTEQLCGYPADYGGDELLAEKITEFLATPDIQQELLEAMEFVNKLPKK
jgi:hypothetical protein